MLHGEAVKIANERMAEWRQAFLAGDAKSVARLYTDDAFLCIGFLGIAKGRTSVETMIAKLVVEQVFVDNCVEDVAHAKYDHFVVSGSYVFEIPGNPKVNGKWGGAFVQQRSHWVLGLHMAVSSLGEFGSRIP